jgi:hypothetical protein
MTLGAAPASIVRLVLRRVTALVALGIALGGLASLWTVRVTEMLLFGLTPRDPVSLVAAALVLAARIDPTVALRNE